MENTNHTLLVGDQATQFALSLGFHETSLTSDKSRKIQADWINNSCQPNYWINVNPDPMLQCGPYHLPQSDKLIKSNTIDNPNTIISSSESERGHDTIGMIVIDSNGLISTGTSTNGLSHKIPG